MALQLLHFTFLFIYIFPFHCPFVFYYLCRIEEEEERKELKRRRDIHSNIVSRVVLFQWWEAQDNKQKYYYYTHTHRETSGISFSICVCCVASSLGQTRKMVTLYLISAESPSDCSAVHCACVYLTWSVCIEKKERKIEESIWNLHLIFYTILLSLSVLPFSIQTHEQSLAFSTCWIFLLQSWLSLVVENIETGFFASYIKILKSWPKCRLETHGKKPPWKIESVFSRFLVFFWPFSSFKDPVCWNPRRRNSLKNKTQLLDPRWTVGEHDSSPTYVVIITNQSICVNQHADKQLTL
jgi:hypothetical protein